MAKILVGAIIWFIAFFVIQLLLGFLIENGDLRGIISGPIALMISFYIIFRETKTDNKKIVSHSITKKVEENNNQKPSKEFIQSKVEVEQAINMVFVKGHPVTGETVNLYNNEKGELFIKLWLTGKFSTPHTFSDKIETRHAYVHFGPFSNEEARNKMKSQIHQKEGELYNLKGRIIALESTNNNGGEIQYDDQLSNKMLLTHQGKPIYRKFKWVAASNRNDDIIERDSEV